MYFVVLWDEWTATIPASWLYLKTKSFKWPPKNAAALSIKGTPPNGEWENIKYKKYVGPFGYYNDGMKFEYQAGDISTNDDEKFNHIDESSTSQLPPKRDIRKPFRYNSSSTDNENDKQNKKELPKTLKKSISLNKQKSNESNRGKEKSIVCTAASKTSKKPPTSYNRKKQNFQNFTNEVSPSIEKASSETHSLADHSTSAGPKEGLASPTLDCFSYYDSQELCGLSKFQGNQENVASSEVSPGEMELLLMANTKHQEFQKSSNDEHNQLFCGLSCTEIEGLHQKLDAIYSLQVENKKQINSLYRKIETMNLFLSDKDQNESEESAINIASKDNAGFCMESGVFFFRAAINQTLLFQFRIR